MSFTALPILTTARLTLRQLSVDDRHDILALRSDPEVNKYLDRQPAKTVRDAIDFINKINDNLEENSALYWAITLTETKKMVGTICVFGFSSDKGSCEIGYELMTEFQRQGIMKEAAQVVIDYVFQGLKFKNILALTHRSNQDSTRLLSKLNFVESMEADRENLDLCVFILTQ